MSLTLADNYLLKALDNYPYEIEKVIEALGYAHSHDDEHAGVHCLYGRIYAEQLKQFDEACRHYKMALYCDATYGETYSPYSRLLIHLGKYDQARRIIDNGLQIQGVDKSSMYYNHAIACESRMEYKQALKWLKQSEISVTCVHAGQFLKEEKRRVKRKRSTLSKNINAKNSTILLSAQMDCAIG